MAQTYRQTEPSGPIQFKSVGVIIPFSCATESILQLFVFIFFFVSDGAINAGIFVLWVFIYTLLKFAYISGLGMEDANHHKIFSEGKPYNRRPEI